MTEPRESDPSNCSIEAALLGRDQELRLLRDFIDRVRNGGGAMLLTGGAGLGKTALLDAAATAAADEGMLVLRAGGSECESDLGFAALNQALIPVLDHIERLGADHRDAIAVALGLREGSAADRLVVSTAVLLLLRHAATERPILLIVDDLPWVDRPSTSIISFVVRRLTGSRVGFLGAARSYDHDIFGLRDLPRRTVAPLSPQASAKLMDQRFPDLAVQARTRLMAEARGNPRAILELPATRGQGQRKPLEKPDRRVRRFAGATTVGPVSAPPRAAEPLQSRAALSGRRTAVTGSQAAVTARTQLTAQELTAQELTAQEREVALMAASGLTNKQIGQRLLMSHRTVGAHLYHLFPKLGVSSRAALRDALSGHANAGLVRQDA
ncbi:helix-turn-helix domain-containing protein [Streptacidiphilus sp. 4-A2]|nr:helix-turn-helix domain-containing protein [Streptacidiphilus sp. 4-A2]